MESSTSEKTMIIIPGRCPVCGAWLLEDLVDGHLYCKYCGWKEVMDIDEE